MGRAIPEDLAVLWRLEGVDAGYWLPPEGGGALEEPADALDTRAILLADVAETLESGAPALRWHAARGGGQHPCAPIINDRNEYEGWRIPGR